MPVAVFRLRIGTIHKLRMTEGEEGWGKAYAHVL